MRKVSMVEKFVLILSALAVLAGCSGSREHGDLVRFVEKSRSEPFGEIQPLPTFHPYQSFKYGVVALRSPFEKPLQIKDTGPAAGKATVKPDESRKKEYLERFNFAAFTMVGTVEQDGVKWSLIDDGQGRVHRVKPGQYLGKNHGFVVSVSDTRVEVKEIVPDGKDGWVERPRTLAIKETK